MTNISIVENKISSVKKYLKILDKYKKCSKKEIEDNVDTKGAVERYLYLAVQSSIDLAEAVVAFRNFRKPTTMRENFYILKEEKIIDNNLSEQLAKMVGFRNIITHDYEKVDYEVVYDILQNGLKDIEKFLEVISQSI